MAQKHHFVVPTLQKEIGKNVSTYIDTLTKPLGSLGRLEKIAIRLAEITGDKFPIVTPPGAIVFAADHGITEEGVSAYPQEVTAQMVQNFLHGGAAMNVFCKQIGAFLSIVDVGVATHIEHENLIAKKVRHGTRNFYKENSMTKAEVHEALEVGRSVASDIIEQGAQTLIVGEMGIGNTTTASAIISVITGEPVQMLIGPGTGLTEAGMEHKSTIVREAIQRRKPDKNDPIDILSKIGGLEIAAMSGAMLTAAENRIPIIVDGLISTSAALIAKTMNERVADYMFVGHHSYEPGHTIAVKSLGEMPLLNLDMRLGEGTGAALAFPLLLSATNMLRHMATFQDAGVSEKSSS